MQPKLQRVAEPLSQLCRIDEDEMARVEGGLGLVEAAKAVAEAATRVVRSVLSVIGGSQPQPIRDVGVEGASIPW